MEPLLKNLIKDSNEHLLLNERFVTLDNETRREALEDFISKLDSGEYQLESSPCLCGIAEDILVSEIDRYGIPLRTVLCKSCGLMRSDPYYTDSTLASFYQNEYRPIYTAEEHSTDLFFENQVRTGVEIREYLKPYLSPQAVVHEIGAGAGGILQAFKDAGHTVYGCDLGAGYINYGISKGIDLHEGDLEVLLPLPKADVLILNHLLEHVKHPAEFLIKAQALLKPEGVIFVGVPGLVLYPVQYRSKLLYYLQNAHAYHYCLHTLHYTASLAGLSLVSGNEKVMSVFRMGAFPMDRPTGMAEFLIEIFEKSQRMADRHKSQELESQSLSARVAEDTVSLRRVRAALKKSRVRVEEQKRKLKEQRGFIEEQTEQVAKLRTELDKKKRELSTIKNSLGWKCIRFMRKTSSFLGITAAYKHVIKKPVMYVAKNWHWHLLFRNLPVNQNVILFESHRGLSYSDSPKAICEAILARGLPIQCVWSLQDTSVAVPKAVRKIKRLSVSYYYYHACARVLIQNGEFAQGLPIRKNQTYINTQHGTPLKLMGIDILYKKPTVDLKSYSKDGRWNYLISPNSYTTEIFKRAFIYTGPVLECGYPRNDIFHKCNNPGDIKVVREKLGLPGDKKIMLYAPTWRDLGGNRIDKNFILQLDIEKLFEEFGNTHVLILRLHHLIVSVLKIDEKFANFAFEFSSAAYDIQELMLVSDILITDYSSVMFDYSNLSRPIIFFAYDLEEYSSDIRGTYFDLKLHAPGPVVENMADLVESIRNIDEVMERFREKEAAFHQKFCSLENGTASDRIIDEIIKLEMNLK